MAEEEKPEKLVETYKAVAAGVASVVAAVFTSKLGVAGTLIGTALTGVVITLTSAVLKAQLIKATDTVSGLPNTVKGRLSTQQLRIPGRPNPEPNPHPAARPDAPKGGRLSGWLSRLRSAPGFLRGLPSNQRRKVLLAGLLAGLVAASIALTTVTGIEVAGGQTLSCLVWTCEQEENAEEGTSRGRGLSILGGYRNAASPSVDTAPSNDPSVDPSGEQPLVPDDGGQIPQQPGPGGGAPEQPAPPGAEGETPEQPGGSPRQPGTPREGADGETPTLPPDTEEPPPGDGRGAEEPASGDQQGLRENMEAVDRGKRA